VEKMKKTSMLAVVLMFIIALTGCLYADIKTPLDIDADKTAIGSKVGKSTIESVLWLVAWGDASTDAAAKNGNISVIYHMDRESFSILFGLYSKSTTIVYGE
jgi:hypothetical protein